MSSDGSRQKACSAAIRPAPPVPRMRMSVVNWADIRNHEEKMRERIFRNDSKTAIRLSLAIELAGEIPRGQTWRQFPRVWQRNAPASPATRLNRSARALSRGSAIRFNARCKAIGPRYRGFNVTSVQAE